jgi:uncharacterized MAPEG superfamily protein
MTSIPLLCLPIAYGLVFVPKLPLSVAMARLPEGYDNKNPRDQQAKLTGWGKRAAAAHANGFESFAPFAAGVLATQLTGASARWAAIFAIAYVVSRLLYAFAYLADVAVLRSSIWTVGFVSTVALMVLPIVS